MQETAPAAQHAPDRPAAASGLLTTKDVQELIRVDRSTIYRMAESGRLPAVKVGRQWRFPAEELTAFLSHGAHRRQVAEATEPIPAEAVQFLADLLGDIFEVMVVITDMDGRPLTEVSNPCGLYDYVRQAPGTLDACIDGWRQLGRGHSLEPAFEPSHLGFLCARGFIRSGASLTGMVIMGGVAPEQWPPPEADVERLATELGLDPADLATHLDEVYYLDRAHQRWIVDFLPRVSVLISRIAGDRDRLLERLDAIAALAGTRSQK